MASQAEYIQDGPDVDEVFDRMVEIVTLITPTQSKRSIVEYSALLCAGVSVAAVSAGVEPTRENLSRPLRLTCDEILPALERELNGEDERPDPTSNGGRR
jgi:hypothetical protein